MSEIYYRCTTIQSDFNFNSVHIAQVNLFQRKSKSAQFSYDSTLIVFLSSSVPRALSVNTGGFRRYKSPHATHTHSQILPSESRICRCPVFRLRNLNEPHTANDIEATLIPMYKATYITNLNVFLVLLKVELHLFNDFILL